MKNKIKSISKVDIILAIILLLIISLVVMLFSYARFYVQGVNNATTTTIQGTFDCLELSTNQTGVLTLNKNYPVTDNYALANFTPVTITMTNNCSASTAAIPYILSLATLYQKTLDYNTLYIPANKVRVKILKTVGTEAETTKVDTNFLSNVPVFTTDSLGYKYTMTHYNGDATYANYTVKDLYNIDEATIASNQSVVYKVYLWIDYYEGDPNRVGGENYDNTTQGLKFETSLAVTLNA